MANDIYNIKKNDLESNSDVCIVKLNKIELPFDVIISINGAKVIASSQILDGVAVFERVTRKPFDIDFDFVIRDKRKSASKTLIPGTTLRASNHDQWIFPLEEINSFFGYCWEPDEVLQVENLLLNKLGIQQVIVEDMQISTIRGNTDVPVKLKCKEDFYSTKTQGTTLLI